MALATAGTTGSGGGGSGTVTSVTAADTSIVVAGTAAAPTVATGTLDVIATDHPPAANWSNNSKKITALANGSGAQDAAAFGQIPTALPPNGSAGGDLSGTYPNPAVKAVTETSGPTDLVIGTIADGQFLKRTGATLVSGAPVASVAATDPSIVVGGTATTPTIATGTLDVIAAQHAPAANWSNNSKKITAIADGSLVQDAMVQKQRYLFQTRPSGALAETLTRSSNTINAAPLASQRVQLVGIGLPGGLTITSITFISATTALVGGNHQIFGLYDDSTAHEGGAAYALLRGTSDDTSTAWGASTAKTLNLTSQYVTVSDGLFYVAILVDAGTVPSLACVQSLTAATGIAPVVTGNSNTGRTTLPNPVTAPSAGAFIPYAYLL